MTEPKTIAERQRAFRERRRQEGLAEVRGIFAHPDDAEAIREHAAKLARRRERATRRLARSAAP